MNLNDMKIGNAYDFSTFATGIWPDMQSAVYDGTVGYTTASSQEAVAQLHAQILGWLPPGVTRNPLNLTYLIFIVNGSSRVMAWEWINQATLKEVVTNTRTVTIVGATERDDARIRQALSGAGFLVSTIS